MLRNSADILILEDRENSLNLRADLFTAEGYTVVTTNFCKNLVAIVKQYSPKLMFLDNKMPQNDSVIKSLPDLREAAPEAKIFITSAYEFSDIEHEIMQKTKTINLPKRGGSEKLPEIAKELLGTPNATQVEKVGKFLFYLFLSLTVVATSTLFLSLLNINVISPFVSIILLVGSYGMAYVIEVTKVEHRINCQTQNYSTVGLEHY